MATRGPTTKNNHPKSHTADWGKTTGQDKTRHDTTGEIKTKRHTARQNTTRQAKKDKAWQSTTTQGQTNRVKEHQQEITTPEASIRKSHPKNRNPKLWEPRILGCERVGCEGKIWNDVFGTAQALISERCKSLFHIFGARFSKLWKGLLRHGCVTYFFVPEFGPGLFLENLGFQWFPGVSKGFQGIPRNSKEFQTEQIQRIPMGSKGFQTKTIPKQSGISNDSEWIPNLSKYAKSWSWTRSRDGHENGAGMNVPNPTFAPTLFAPGSIMENNRCKPKHTSTHKHLKNHSQEQTTLKATIKDSHVNNHNHKHCDLIGHKRK